MNPKYEKLKALLKELFQLDQPDLDFGLYRILHARSAEINQFLDHDLLPQVRQAFEEYQPADKAELEKQLREKSAQYRADGLDPDSVPGVQKLRQQLNEAVDLSQLENEVYEHLYSFFRRYYNEGDFLSLRRYKEGVYAIPYEGEEVKLHWANADQYYIKTSEYLRDYAFRLRPGDAQAPMRVHFRLVDAAEGEHGNVKAAEGKDRLFILADGDFMAEEDGELIIRFEYRPARVSDWEAGENKKPPTQKDLIEIAVQRILTPTPHHPLTPTPATPWLAELGRLHVKADGEKAEYSRLEAHLRRYTARNTFDYFIHKDMGGFLRRELDFYIKNEVLRLDDIESESAPRVEQFLSKIKVLRRVAGKMIDFLAQLEDFQKKLWLKKKFVVATSYCVAVGQIPETFYAEIVANEAQLAEWRSLLGLNKLMAETPLLNQGEISADTLRRYPTLMVDTGHFSPDFTTRLLHALSDLDEQTNGVLFHSDNFQALALIQRRYRKKIKCVYIDPPYNTDASPIVYKNGYRRSSWASLMEDRMGLDVNLRIPNSLRCIAIDDFEYANLCGVLESLADGVRHATVAVRSKPQGRPTATGFSTNHEYVLFWGDPDAKIGRLPRSGSKAERYPYSDELGIYAWANFRKSGTDSDRSDRPKSFYPVYAKTDSVRIPAMTWDEVLLRWRVTENPSLEEEVVWPIDSDNNEKVWTCSSSRAQDEIADIRVERDSDGHLEIYKKYRPNQDGALPGTWWEDSGYSASESGTKVLKDLFGAKEFDYPKSINLVVDCLRVGQLAGNDTVLDYFAGSGTTGHAVINLSREDNEQRRFVLVEMGDYFDTVLMPRLKKVTFTPEWKDGQPQRPATPEEAERSPRLFKVLRLESYEDTLNNLQTIRTQGQQSLLDRLEAQGPDGLREQYLLRYLLDVETRGSQSLLNIQGFNDPTAYKLLVKTPGSDESREVSVDLLETFNWLIGLTVRHIAMPQTFRAAFERDSEGRLRLDGHLKPDAAGPFWFRTVTGATPDGRETLIIWRKLTGNVEEDNLALDEWFTRQGYSSKDSEFDLIYVNGGNNLENLKAPDDTWKVRLIEEDFHRLMFTE